MQSAVLDVHQYVTRWYCIKMTRSSLIDDTGLQVFAGNYSAKIVHLSNGRGARKAVTKSPYLQNGQARTEVVIDH